MRRYLDSRSPLQALALIVGAIFTAEFAVMMVIPRGLSPLTESVMDAGCLTAVLLPLLLLLVVRPLSHRVAEAEGARAALQEAHDRLDQRVQERTVEVEAVNLQLHAAVAELERRNREAALLAEMTDLMHGCTSVEEVHRVIGRLGPRLLPGLSGALFTFSPSRDDLEAVARWGVRAAALGDRVMDPDKCWSLRRGRPGHLEGLCTGSPCAGADGIGHGQCIPMTAQGETLGLLHLQEDTPGAGQPGPDAIAVRRPLATAAAEQMGLALANLRLRDMLRSQSIRDPLTGLFNRRFMEETLARELRRAERSQRPLALIMLDLDHFKRFNDTFGHEAGDTILRETGGLLNANTRGGDVACRYGGEEFLLILPDCSQEAACARAEELRQRIGRLTVVHLGRPLRGVTASLGLSAYPAHGSNAESLLRVADGALYRAKQAGRDRVMVAEAGACPPVPGGRAAGQ